VTCVAHNASSARWRLGGRLDRRLDVQLVHLDLGAGVGGAEPLVWSTDAPAEDVSMLASVLSGKAVCMAACMMVCSTCRGTIGWSCSNRTIVSSGTLMVISWPLVFGGVETVM